jgi:hypothetical protein
VNGRKKLRALISNVAVKKKPVFYIQAAIPPDYLRSTAAALTYTKL